MNPSTSYFFDEDEIKVCEILVDLPTLVYESECRRQFSSITWAKKRKRSALRCSSSTTNNTMTAAAVTPSPCPQPETKNIIKIKKNKKVEAAAASPSTPLSFTPSESDENKSSKQQLLKSNSKKRTREEWLEIIDGLTQNRELLKGELETLRSKYYNLSAINLELKSKKQEQPSTSTPASSLYRSHTIPSGQLVLDPSEAQTSLELQQNYQSIYHNRAATWISPMTNPFPDVIRPINHLPDYIRNLLGFLYEGRDDLGYQQLYLNYAGELVDTIVVEGGIPEWSSSDILKRFGKYLWGESPAWNTSFALSGWLRQDEMVVERINRFCKRYKFRLEANDPFLTGVRIQDFDPERDFGAVFSSTVDERVKFLSVHDLKDTSKEALHNLIPEADDTELEDLLREVDDYRESPSHTTQGSPEAYHPDPDALQTYRRRTLRKKPSQQPIQEEFTSTCDSSVQLEAAVVIGKIGEVVEELQGDDQDVQEEEQGALAMEMKETVKRDDSMDVREGVVEDVLEDSDDNEDTLPISSILRKASAPETSGPSTSAPLPLTPPPTKTIHSPPSSTSKPSPKRQKTTHPSSPSSRTPPTPRQPPSFIQLSIPPNTASVAVDPTTGIATFYTQFGQIIPNLTQIESVVIPQHIPNPSDQMTLAFPSIFRSYSSALRGSVILSFLSSRAFQLFLLVQLYMSQRRPLSLLAEPFYPLPIPNIVPAGPVIIEDLSSDSEDFMDVEGGPNQEEAQPAEEFMAVDEDEVAVGAGAIGLLPTPAITGASSSRLDVIPQLVDTGIFERIEDLEFRRAQKEDMLEECVKKTGDVLEQLLTMVNCIAGQVIQSTCTQEFNSTDTGIKIDAAVETVTRSLPHHIENAVQRALVDRVATGVTDSAIRQAAEMEDLRARLAVAEELAVNAMKEEKRKAALLQHVLKENYYLREALANRKPISIPPLPTTLEKEALASLALQQESRRIKKAKKLAKRNYTLKLLSEISSDSSDDGTEEDLTGLCLKMKNQIDIPWTSMPCSRSTGRRTRRLKMLIQICLMR